MNQFLKLKTTKYIAIAMVLFTTVILSTPMRFNYIQSYAQTVETEQFTGELTKKEANKLFVTKDNTVTEYLVYGDLKVKRDGTSSALDRLQAGDLLQVTLNKNTKELLAVDVVSKGVVDNSIIGVGALVSLLVLSGIVYYFVRRSNRGTIRTSSTEYNN
jgi:hypothetical protein